MRKRTRPHLSIAAKLLLWCLALVAVFGTTTAVILFHMDSMADAARREVERNYRVDAASKRMIRLLLSVRENDRLYGLTGKGEFRRVVARDLDAYGRVLAGLAADPSLEPEPWRTLLDQYRASADKGPGGIGAVDEEMAEDWISLLATARLKSGRGVQEGVRELNRLGRAAVRAGVAGLILSLVVGLGGSGLVAFRLTRGLRALTRSIGEVGREGAPGQDPGAPPMVPVTGSDEMAQVARAFNRMSVRLSREEELRRDFISMLSHEIRTPLTSIRESVDMVLDGVFGEVGEKQARFLGIARQEALRLSGLLDRLMRASALECKGLDPAREEAEAGKLVLWVLQRLESQARAESVELAMDLPAGEFTFTADPDQLGRALLNLAGNAVKFSPPGREVVVRAEPGPDGGARFSVLDRGPGIPEEDKDLLFQKFYRGAGAGSGKEGTGLGLSIARSVVLAHGGTVRHEDRQGGGSVFVMEIPDQIPASTGDASGQEG